MKISSYAVLSNPQLGDKLIGTDVNNMDVTKNFTIESLFQLGSSSGLFVPYTGASNDVDLGLNSIRAVALIKDGGTASQFLKADGTIDNNTYLTSSSLTGLVVPYTGATTNVNLGSNSITANSIIKVGGTSSQFLKADGSVDSTQYAPAPTYKVLTIGNIAYDGTTLYSTSVLENTIGSFTVDMFSPNQLRVTLDDYVLVGIDLNSLYISSQNTSLPSGGVFQADLEESNLAAGEILFMCVLLDGLSTTTILEIGNLEIRLYN
jgi:hypothetical protein